jgi:hypothetical protein
MRLARKRRSATVVLLLLALCIALLWAPWQESSEISSAIESISFQGGFVSDFVDSRGPWSVSFNAPGMEKPAPGFVNKLLPDFKRLTALSALNLEGCELNELDWDALAQLKQIEQLGLVGVDVTCNDLKRLAASPRLKTVWVQEGCVTEDCLDEVRKLNTRIEWVIDSNGYRK